MESLVTGAAADILRETADELRGKLALIPDAMAAAADAVDAIERGSVPDFTVRTNAFGAIVDTLQRFAILLAKHSELLAVMGARTSPDEVMAATAESDLRTGQIITAGMSDAEIESGLRRHEEHCRDVRCRTGHAIRAALRDRAAKASAP